MVRIPTHRTPTHPGEMLLEEFLTPLNLSQRELADAIHISYQRINEIVNGCRGSTQTRSQRRRWEEIGGKAPYPLANKDDQEWVSRTRAESDEGRSL